LALGASPLGDAFRALVTDRRLVHAIGADRPVTPCAPDVSLLGRVAVADRDRRGSLTHVSKVLQSFARSISTRSTTTSSRGRSPGPVGVVAIESTTLADCSSATWPKIVCRRFRCGVGPTVMKN